MSVFLTIDLFLGLCSGSLSSVALEAMADRSVSESESVSGSGSKTNSIESDSDSDADKII